MPAPTTNRPFFANFFAAFRAHSALQKSSPAINSTPTSSSVTQHYYSTAAAQSQADKHTSHSSTSSSAQPQSHFRNSRPLHPPTGTPHNPGPRSTSRDAGLTSSTSPSTTTAPTPQTFYPTPSNATPFTIPSRTPSPLPMSAGQSSYFPSQARARRGSDTSEGSGSGGGRFGTSPGAEKWYIGGRTAGGEERFYKLGFVKAGTRSADRLSLDRLSL